MFFNKSFIWNISRTFVKRTKWSVWNNGSCLNASFLQRWPGSFLLALFMFTSTNVTGGLWLDAVKRRADVILPYMGTEVDVKPRLSEMFPGNGGIWIANQQGSGAIWQTLRATPTCFHSEPRAHLQRTAQNSLYHFHGTVVLHTRAVFLN